MDSIRDRFGRDDVLVEDLVTVLQELPRGSIVCVKGDSGLCFDVGIEVRQIPHNKDIKMAILGRGEVTYGE